MNVKIIALVAAVCFAASAPRGPAAADPGKKLLVGHLRVTGHAKLFVAKEEGFFADEGLDVELIHYSNSSDGLAALWAGKLDVGVFGTTAPLVYIANGKDIRIIGGVMGEDAYVVTNTDKVGRIDGVGDLKGMRLATVRLSSGDAVLRGALLQAGLSLKDDLSIVELNDPAAVLEAVRNGQADAGVIWGPYDLEAVRRGMTLVLATADMFPGHPCCRIAVAGERYLKTGTTVWTKFLRAVLRAERFTQSSDPAKRTRTVADIARYLDFPTELIEEGYYHGRLDQASDPNIQGVLRVWNAMLRTGYIDAATGPETAIELQPFSEALSSLEKEEEDEPYWKEVRRLYEARNLKSD